jgi:hypothetical protein
MDKATSKLGGTLYSSAVGEANSLATMKHLLSKSAPNKNLLKDAIYFMLVNKKPTRDIKERINELLKLGACLYWDLSEIITGKSYTNSIQAMVDSNHHNLELWSALLQTNMAIIEQDDLDYALQKMVRLRLEALADNAQSEQYVSQIELLVARGAKCSDNLIAAISAQNNERSTHSLSLISKAPVYDKLIKELRASKAQVTEAILQKYNLPNDPEIMKVLQARLDAANKLNEQLSNNGMLTDLCAIIGEYCDVPGADISNPSYILPNSMSRAV